MILETAIRDGEVMQDFDLESLPIGGAHSQTVKGPPIGKDYGSKDCVNSPSPIAVSRMIHEWLKTQNLDEVEVLYIIGLIPVPQTILKWLSERKYRALIFIEEDLETFLEFNHLLDNPQIHLYHSPEEIPNDFPCDRIAIFEGKPFDALALQRRIAFLSALYSDVLYSHKIVENVIANYSRLHQCFDANALQFKNTPAIICGAGPSLEKSFSALREAGDKALIFAGGSAIPILARNNIRPHFAMALDPNHEELDRLKQNTATDVPFLFAPRVHHEVLPLMTGPLGYLKTDTGGLFESWLEEKLGLTGIPTGPDMGPEAFSVTTLAISYAYALGCNPIILTGVDLAYTSGKRYASGVEAEKGNSEDPRALEKVQLRTDIYGEPVETLLKWVMESDCISTFAKNHPETNFLNASQGGLGFEGIENVTLEQALKPLKKTNFVFQFEPLQFNTEHFYELLTALDASLDRCHAMCDLPPILAQMDLEEEEAYKALLDPIAAALDRVLIRYYPHIDPEEAQKQRENAKFKELKLQIEKFKKIIGKQCAQLQ